MSNRIVPQNPALSQLPLWDQPTIAHPQFSERIRRVVHEGVEYFSLVDLMAEFSDTEANARYYWRDTKKRLKTDGFQLGAKISQLKMVAKDGKERLTDVADGQTCLRIIQSVPSPKAEHVREWFASIGYERIEEAANPELGLERSKQRAIEAYRRQGKSDEWISERLETIAGRNVLTATLKERVIGAINFALATDTEYIGVFHRTAKQIKAQHGHKNARDGMTRAGLHLIGACEAAITEHLEGREYVSFEEALALISEVSQIIGQSADRVQSLLGIDLATGKKLLGD
jgi:hypothetical protein